MSTIQLLSEIEDSRRGGKTAKFNGFLEDYLHSDAPIREEVKESLLKVLDAYPDFRIMTDYRFNVNREAISNQIIRYKDVAKLPTNYYDMALILYGAISNNRELVVLIADGTRNVDYFLAKGMYYTLTEQYGVLENSRQEVIVVTMAQLDRLLDIVNEFNNDPRLRVAPFQRRLDKEYFENFEDLHTQVDEIAHAIKDSLPEDLGIVRDRSLIIFRNIASWYLFKKLLYVSYMSNKDFLNNKADGNMRQHRNNAKQIVDAIPFVAFSEMWRMRAVRPGVNTEEIVVEQVLQQDTTPEAKEEPVIEDPKTEELVVEDPVAEEPVVEFSADEEPVLEIEEKKMPAVVEGEEAKDTETVETEQVEQ